MEKSLVFDIIEDYRHLASRTVFSLFTQKRVQKSVFLGNIEKDETDEIVLESKKVINLREDSLYIFPVCEADHKKASYKNRKSSKITMHYFESCSTEIKDKIVSKLQLVKCGIYQ